MPGTRIRGRQGCRIWQSDIAQGRGKLQYSQTGVFGSLLGSDQAVSPLSLWCPQLRGHHRSQPSHVCTNHCQAGCCGAQMDGRPRRLQLCCQLQAREAQLWCRRSFKTSHWSSLFISQCSVEPGWLHSRVSHHKRWSEWRNHRVTHSVTGREMEWGAAERSCPEWGDSTSQDWKETYKGGAIAVESRSPAFPEWVVQTQCAWRCHLPQEGEPRWRRVLATAMPCAVPQSRV